MIRWLAMLTIAALLFGGLYFVDAHLRGEKLSDAPVEQVSTEMARQRIFAAGFLAGEHDEVVLKFEIPGRLRRVLVSTGSRVKAGQLVAELDPSAWELQLAEAQARLALARAQRELLLSGNHATTAAWRGVSPGAQSAPPAPQRIPVSLEEVQVADAQVKIAETALNYQRLLIDRTRLVAPCDGDMVHLEASPGDLVGPADLPERIVLAPHGDVVVRAYVEELDALDVRVGQRAIVVAPARRDREFAGTVTTCAPELRPKSIRHNLPGERLDVRVREVTITLDEPSRLPHGLPVEVFITPREKNPAPSEDAR
ncbi:MAG: efflux RND transporter periplasmic adaptor subunit [Planctomycetia bacterium]|nr:efflux RND transporter periplasmic adaptor subunit [Planctomycetia bacterium]